MSEKISDYTNERLIPLADDLLDISITNDGGTTFPESQRITYANLATGVNNIYNTDGQLLGDRIVDIDSNELEFTNGDLGIGTSGGLLTRLQVRGPGSTTGTFSLGIQNLLVILNVYSF